MLSHFTNLRIESNLTLTTASGAITMTGDSRDDEGLQIKCSSPDVFRKALKMVKNQGIGTLQANRFLRKLPSSGQNLRLTIDNQEIFRIQNNQLTIHYTRLLPFAGTLLFG